MENIVYILGAGFSAPLGLPVMGNFWERSKSLARRYPEKYDYFSKVIDRINDTSKTQSYFEYTPFNIEEALSIIEMDQINNEGLSAELLKKFICAVVIGSTPPVPNFRSDKLPIDQQWKEHLFGGTEYFKFYGFFVASLNRLKIEEWDPSKDYGIRQFRISEIEESGVSYSVISLNYDTVLEDVCKYINAHFGNQNLKARFVDHVSQAKNESRAPVLIKLHGSVADGNIIPPTFNKGLYHSDIPELWKSAYNILMNANQIRIIGYSLPSTDSYIKYLIKSAVTRSFQLEKIDVICKDDSGEVKARYDAFVKFRNYQFKKEDVISYLGQNYQLWGAGNVANTISFDKLERAHGTFMADRYR